VFTYNRPIHTIKTLKKINDSLLAPLTNIFIFSDAAKNEDSIEKVKLTREALRNFSDSNNFKKCTIYEASINKGLAKSVIEGVTKIINKYGKVIVLEDDLIVSDDYLQYMNAALAHYEKDSKIWSISGYSFPMKSLIGYKDDYYLSYRGCSWGWGTWKDRWMSVDWDVVDYRKFKYNTVRRRRFDRGGSDLSIMLDLQMAGKIDSWAIRWCYAQSKQCKLTIYPTISRIKNIGTDGTGTHSPNTGDYDTELYIGKIEHSFPDLRLCKRISRDFKRKFDENYFKSTLRKIRYFAFRVLEI